VDRTEIPRNWIAATRKHFALRRSEKPATKAGQIRALWPEIKAALAEGQSMKTIRTWLEQDAGLALNITSFTSYVSRIRRRELRHAASRSQARADNEPHVPCTGDELTLVREAARPDPLAPAMEILRQRRFDIREIHGDGDPTDKNLI
jgi:hypothetical protein